MNELRYFSDRVRPSDSYKKTDWLFRPRRIDSKVEFFNAVTGEQIWEPLHNRTVIAGSALMAMKLFNLDRAVLDNTPTYDTVLELENGADGSAYPTKEIKNRDGSVVGTTEDECQRTIIGFCIGQGGAGLDISDVFDVKYCSWITPDNLIPFRYPLTSADDVDETMYKGKKHLSLPNGQERNAYYFKAFSNTPNLVQNYVTTIGTFSDDISPSTVYANTASADKAQSYIEMHLKVTPEDAREFFITHKGIENAKINQISLVYGWQKTFTVNKLSARGDMVSKDYQYFQDIRPFSMINIPNEIMSNLEKSLSIVYTIYV